MKQRAALICLIVAIFALISSHFVVDDGLIYARYIQNALSGQGLVFNSGESFNALTSPLFTNLLLGLSWILHGRVLLAEHILFALALIAACLEAERLVPWSGVAVASTAYFYATIGLESSLFLLLIMLTVRAYSSGRYEWLPLLLTLTLLTRFEGGLLIVIVGYHLCRERRFPRLISFLPALAIILLYLGLNHHWYGSILPNSASSKFGQARSQYWGKWPKGFFHVWPWVFDSPNAFFRYTIYVIPLILFFGFKGWQTLRDSRWGSVLTPFWLGLLAFYVLFNMPAYHWYYAPLIFISILYAVQGVPKQPRAASGMLAVIALAGLTNLLVVHRFEPAWDYINAAEWINANTPQNATVETVELGHIGWYTHRHVIDILGLTYPPNADHIAHHDPVSWLAQDRPDYIIVHKPMPIYEQVTALHPEYQPVPFHSGNIYILHRVAPFRPIP